MSVNQIRPTLEEVAAERLRQVDKWGHQNHRDGTGMGLLPTMRFPEDPDGQTWPHHLRSWAILRCDQAHRDGRGTWEHILTEEWAEALAETDPAKLRTELIQVAAVACAWVESIDRRAG